MISFISLFILFCLFPTPSAKAELWHFDIVDRNSVKMMGSEQDLLTWLESFDQFAYRLERGDNNLKLRPKTVIRDMESGEILPINDLYFSKHGVERVRFPPLHNEKDSQMKAIVAKKYVTLATDMVQGLLVDGFPNFLILLEGELVATNFRSFENAEAYIGGSNFFHDRQIPIDWRRFGKTAGQTVEVKVLSFITQYPYLPREISILSEFEDPWQFRWRQFLIVEWNLVLVGCCLILAMFYCLIAIMPEARRENLQIAGMFFALMFVVAYMSGFYSYWSLHPTYQRKLFCSALILFSICLLKSSIRAVQIETGVATERHQKKILGVFLLACFLSFLLLSNDVSTWKTFAVIAGLIVIVATAVSLFLFYKFRSYRALRVLKYSHALLILCAFEAILNFIFRYSSFASISTFASVIALSHGVYFSTRFRRQHRKLQGLKAELEVIIEDRNNNIRTLLDHIPQGILSIRKGGVIGREYSAHLKHILELEQIENETFDKLILPNIDLSADKKDQLWQTILASLGNSDLNFLVNADKFPSEFYYQTHTGVKILQATWNCQTNGPKSKVEQILVTLHDITGQKKLEKQAAEQQRENQILIEVSKSLPDKSNQFFDKFSKTILELESLFCQLNMSDKESTEQPYLLIHTLKGYARILDFTLLADRAHCLEGQLDQFMKQGTEHLLKDIVESFSILQDIYRKYEHSFFYSLGYAETKEIYAKMNLSEVERQLKEILNSFDDKAQSRIEMLYKNLMEGESVLFASVFENVKQLSAFSSHHLGKPEPEFRLTGENISIPLNLKKVLDDCFQHVITNIMDHGIEDPSVRVEKGKRDVGTISIQASTRFGEDPRQQGFEIIVSDDGAGLSLENLIIRAFGEERRREDLSTAEIKTVLDSVFDFKVSTKSSVSMTSGRGAGLSAVRWLMESLGGSVSLMVSEEDFLNAARPVFKLKLNIPYHSGQGRHKPEVAG